MHGCKWCVEALDGSLIPVIIFLNVKDGATRNYALWN